MRPPVTSHRAGSLKIKQHLLRTILVPNVVHKLQLPLFLTQTPFWQLSFTPHVMEDLEGNNLRYKYQPEKSGDRNV